MDTRVFTYFVLLIAFFVYSGFVYTVGTEDTVVLDAEEELVLAGKKVFQARNCTACHQIFGLGGHLGPDLTNVISHPSKGREYAKAIIQSGIGPMPRFEMSEQELDALLAFLSAVDQSGESPLRSFRVTTWGSIELLPHAGATVQ